MWRRALASGLLLSLAAACSGREGSTLCGISALAGPVMILDQFSVPGQTLGVVPVSLPEALTIRVAAGPVVRGLVGRADSLLVIGVDEPLPPGPPPGFGVLIQSPEGRVRGVVLFEGAPIPGAPGLGTVQAGDRSLPLIGLRVATTRIEDPRCPLFPDTPPR